MKTWLLTFMFLFLLQCCIAQEKRETPDYDQSPTTNQTNSSPIEPPVSQQESSDRNNERNQNAYSDRGKLSAADIINCISTAAVAVFTIVLAIYTVLLWKSGERHSERELRAYLSINPGRVLIDKDKSQIRGAVCVVKNHGRTPAFDINFLFGISVLPIGAELPATTGKIKENMAIFPEAHLFPNFWAHPFTSEETAKVMEEKTHRLHI
jgi:hypothetical protein